MPAANWLRSLVKPNQAKPSSAPCSWHSPFAPHLWASHAFTTSPYASCGSTPSSQKTLPMRSSATALQHSSDSLYPMTSSLSITSAATTGKIVFIGPTYASYKTSPTSSSLMAYAMLLVISTTTPKHRPYLRNSSL